MNTVETIQKLEYLGTILHRLDVGFSDRAQKVEVFETLKLMFRETIDLYETAELKDFEEHFARILVDRLRVEFEQLEFIVEEQWTDHEDFNSQLYAVAMLMSNLIIQVTKININEYLGG